MNRLDIQYQNLLRDIIDNGTEKEDRTGTGTISVFGRQIRHNMQDGFPLLTTKKMAVKSMMTELKWFLKGRTDIQYLRDNGCKIWDGDFEKAGKEDGTLGPIYGKQWRNWNVKVPHKTMDGVYHTRTIDQIQNLINELKTNPNSRRLIVSAWNVGELEEMSLPPCHYVFQLNVRGEYLDLMWNQRSVDTFLGLPFNIASYGLLLSLIAYETGYKPGSLIGSLGDTHLYSNHIEQAKEQIKRTSFELPTLNIISSDLLNGEFEVEFENYISLPAIKAPLSN